jgi:predicted phosphodiesterase
VSAASDGIRFEPAPERIAVLADVHGNLPALEAVAADLAELSPDRVIVNGDMVNRGPSGVEVLAFAAERGWTMTLGNHDDLVRMWVDRDPALPSSWFDDPFWRATGWCAEQIEAGGWLPAIGRLPMTVAIEPARAASILVSHGSPRHYREGYGKHLADEAVSEIVEMHPYDVLVGSHTHQPLERRWARHLILNSGAVGTPFNGDPRAQYLFLERDGAGWRHAFRTVDYDRRAATEAYVSSGYLDAAGFSARIFWLELATARSWMVPFLMWSERNDAPRNEAGWQRFLREGARPVVGPDEVGREVVERSGLGQRA